MSCQPVRCPCCGDVLVHQTHRGAKESSSSYGQHIYDSYPKDFYFCDIDGVIFKRATSIMRILEVKKPGQGLKPSQSTILGILGLCLEMLIRHGQINNQSGVFRVCGEPPYSEIEVTPLKNGQSPSVYSGVEQGRFETGLEL